MQRAKSPASCRLDRFAAGALITVDTGDFEEFRAFAPGWNIEHHLIGSKRTQITMSAALTPGMQLARVRQSVAYSSHGQAPKGTISIALPLEHGRPMIQRGQSLGPLSMAAVHSGEEFELINPAGTDHILTSFQQSRIEQYAADILVEPHLWQQRSIQFADAAARDRYLHAGLSILKDLDEDQSMLNEPRTAALLEEALLSCLLLQSFDERGTANSRSRYRAARLAHRYLLENVEEMPSVRKLCAITGSSYMTLERGFRDVYGTTPQKHIQSVRLSRARRELLNPTSLTTVTDVALRCGFFELGRFSVRYRQRFGESPSETLRKVRGERWCS